MSEYQPRPGVYPSYSSSGYGPSVAAAEYGNLETYPLTATKHPMGPSATMADPEEDRYYFDQKHLDKVQRRLKQRHVQMIAIAGTIGTGLFLGSGSALARAGPLGALMAYAFVGTVAYSSLCSLGEMACFAPISGTFPHFASRWVDPAFGFAVGWNYFYQQAMAVPVEITAATILLTFWDENHSRRIAYTAIIIMTVCSINLFGVRYFGESEFVFSIIKLLLITALILFGLVIDLGGGPNHDLIGFRYWKNPGALNTYLDNSNKNTGRFLALLGVLVQAAFSYQGMELVAIAASETESPRRNIAKAVKRVFYRILIFYILGVFVTGLIVPSNNPHLLGETNTNTTTTANMTTTTNTTVIAKTAAVSPYVIAMQIAGVKGLPHVVNAAVFTSALSAGNSFLFTSSRVLYGLSLRGQAPKIFSRCTENGLPVFAVLASSSFALLAFMNVSKSSTKVFQWLVNLTTVGGFFTWMSINVTFLRFYAGLKHMGVDRSQFVYYNSLQPYLSIWGVFWTSFLILINGFAVFWNFKTEDFLTAYINIPIFFGLFLVYKFINGTHFWKVADMDFVRGIPTLEETEEEPRPPRTFAEKVAEKVF